MVPLRLTSIDDRSYRPILHWFWDTDPTEVLIERQLQAVAAVGFGGVCIQPLPEAFRPEDFPQRMRVPYLGDEFLAAYRHAVQTAADLGLTVWLYDEGGWPSGHANGGVLAGFEGLEGQMLVYEAGRYVHLATGQVDRLKSEATRRFIELTHERYRQAVGEFFGTTIEAVFSDEITVPGAVGTDRIPWTDDMAEQFARRAGYELDSVLPLLFEGPSACGARREPVRQARWDYTMVWQQLLAERCLAPQRAWCDAHGLQLTGHLAGEQDLARHPVCAGDYFNAMRAFDIPGIDTIWRQIWPDHRADFALLAGSARVMHRRAHAMTEMGGSYGEHFPPSQLRWVTDQQILRGVNRLTLMKMPMSGTLAGHVQSRAVHHPINPTWESLTDWADHTARLASLTSLGRPGVRCGVLYPSDDLAACGANGTACLAEHVVSVLLRSAAGCVYVDGRTLWECNVTDGRARCGDADLDTICVVGGSMLSARTAEALDRLCREGVRVLVVGEDGPTCLPARDGADTPPVGEWLRRVRLDELAEVVSRGASFSIASSGKDLVVQHRVGEDWNLLVVSNEGETDAHAVVRLPSTGVLVEVDVGPIRTGTPMEGVGRLDLTPGQVVAVGWGNIVALKASPSEALQRRSLSPDWSIQPDWRYEPLCPRPGRHTLDEPPRVACLGRWCDELGAHFSGQATYRASIEIDEPADRVVLDLGTVEHTAELFVNGTRVGRRSWAPYQFDITALLQPGRNELAVAVRNTRANAWWRPAIIRQLQRGALWNAYADRVADRCRPVLDGGLLGPVSLLAPQPRGKESGDQASRPVGASAGHVSAGSALAGRSGAPHTATARVRAGHG